ncbi:MAG: hypothetical protein AAB477_01695 [Patescibacteria group bacterium]
MQTKIKNLKYIIFGFVVILFSTLFVSQVHAADTYPANGNNGIVWSIVDIAPTTLPTNTGFTATGDLQSASTTVETVSLTVKNNNGSPVAMIPATLGNTVQINPSQIISAAQISFTSPGSGGTYPVEFTTNVDVIPVPIQNYAYNTNLGAIIGICHIMPDPNEGKPGSVTATRDVATEQDALARGVTHVSVDYGIITNNTLNGQPNWMTSYIHADFYPGDLELSLPGYEYGIDHDANGYCSESFAGDVIIQEYF